MSTDPKPVSYAVQTSGGKTLSIVVGRDAARAKYDELNISGAVGQGPDKAIVPMVNHALLDVDGNTLALCMSYDAAIDAIGHILGIGWRGPGKIGETGEMDASKWWEANIRLLRAMVNDPEGSTIDLIEAFAEMWRLQFACLSRASRTRMGYAEYHRDHEARCTLGEPETLRPPL